MRCTHAPVPQSTLPAGEIRQITVRMLRKLYDIQEDLIVLLEATPDEVFSQEEWDILNAQGKANAAAMVFIGNED